MLYQVTIGERVLAVRLRREGERTFVSVDDGPEQAVRLDVVRGPLRSLVLGDQRSELWFFYHLGLRVKQRLADSTDERDRPVQDLDWDYEVHGDEPSAESVLRAISAARPLITTAS